MNDLTTMLGEALGFPLISPEPEVLAADLARIQCKTLASIIATLLNENEPLLKAEASGTAVIVCERGGPLAMQFTITSREPVRANNAPGSDK